MSPLLYELRDVVQEYGGREVLRVPKLDLYERRITGLAGPNGSGKSTLMRLLAFLESPAHGVVKYAGNGKADADNGVRREVTLLTQEPYLLKRSVAANVAYGMKVRGLGASLERVGHSLEMVGLDPELFMHRAWYELSGGEAQRVALAARLVLRPKVLLLDEPTASLDEVSVDRIHHAVLAAREQWGTTLVVVSHDMGWLNKVCDEIISLRSGRIQSPDNSS
ncbi:ABC transporter ATP-binding protein [Desulfovibrio ferrophilus]|uniref:ABC transporter n=1 Tax=Desulfovibrio ferrophilus TaxID=241368 RepID=A0A2Z6AVU8_9BACT|nr:ABC transporter ATP-binding protein [Desulfovibrio ferrophilus]BBD07364.1 ABC transporter [Desulfovibrio ferrophilus]